MTTYLVKQKKRYIIKRERVEVQLNTLFISVNSRMERERERER